MKKWMMLAAVALAGTAGAQSWDTDEGKLTLVGCYGKQDGVYCDFSFVLTKKQTAKLYWYAERFKVFKQDGTAQDADKTAFVDGKFDARCCGYSSEQEIIANVPVKVQVYFNTPSAISNFRALAYKNVKFDNIPVRPYGASAPAPAPTTTTPAVKLPFPAAFTFGSFKGNFSNCQQQGASYVCTATVTRK